MTRLLLATGNAHKVDEVQQILGAGYEVEAHDPGVEETGATFEENALIKARALVERDRRGWPWPTTPASRSTTSTARPASARPAGPTRATGSRGCCASSTWRRPRRTGCRYVCAAAAVWPDGREVVVRGEVEGVIVDAPRGDGGFGYDPIVRAGRGRRPHLRRDDRRREARHQPPRAGVPPPLAPLLWTVSIAMRPSGFTEGAGHQPRRSTSQIVDDVVAVDHVEALVLGDGGVDVGGEHPHPVADGHRGALGDPEGDVLVGHEPAVADVEHRRGRRGPCRRP